MPLSVTRRKDTGALTITGTIRFPDGSRRRIRQTAQSRDETIAREEAALLEARELRAAWHGERRGARSFAEAALSYLKAAPRRPAEQQNLVRIGRALGNIALGAVNQVAIDRARDRMFPAGVSPSTVKRSLISPVRAVLNHAHRRGWCTAPVFEIPREPKGRTRFFMPVDAERLIEAAAPHLKPLFVFMITTGARVSEAIELEWRDVDLQGGRVTFWKTKGGERRIASLCPRAVAALAVLGHRNGHVFRWETCRPYKVRDGEVRRGGVPLRTVAYADRGRAAGGQFRTGWRNALRRAGIDQALTPHDLRHTWASWHYALHRDLLRLKVEGAWSSVALVERYAHLMPDGQEEAIRGFLVYASVTTPEENRATA